VRLTSFMEAGVCVCSKPHTFRDNCFFFISRSVTAAPARCAGPRDEQPCAEDHRAHRDQRETAPPRPRRVPGSARRAGSASDIPGPGAGRRPRRRPGGKAHRLGPRPGELHDRPHPAEQQEPRHRVGERRRAGPGRPARVTANSAPAGRPARASTPYQLRTMTSVTASQHQEQRQQQGHPVRGEQRAGADPEAAAA